MGASGIFMTVKSTDRETIREEFDERKREDEYEYGHGAYSGTFATFSGLTIKSMTFNNEEDAEDWILNKSEKWADAIAVTVAEEGKEPYTLIGGWAAT